MKQEPRLLGPAGGKRSRRAGTVSGEEWSQAGHVPENTHWHRRALKLQRTHVHGGDTQADTDAHSPTPSSYTRVLTLKRAHVRSHTHVLNRCRTRAGLVAGPVDAPPLLPQTPGAGSTTAQSPAWAGTNPRPQSLRDRWQPPHRPVNCCPDPGARSAATSQEDEASSTPSSPITSQTREKSTFVYTQIRASLRKSGHPCFAADLPTGREGGPSGTQAPFCRIPAGGRCPAIGCAAPALGSGHREERGAARRGASQCSRAWTAGPGSRAGGPTC